MAARNEIMKDNWSESFKKIRSQVNSTKYPVWRRNLDIYQAWYTNGNVTNAALAERFGVSENTVKRAINAIGDLMYIGSKPGCAYEEVEAIFVTVAHYADEGDVYRISKIIRNVWDTVDQLYACRIMDLRTVNGVGPKYADILDRIRNRDAAKEMHIRTSFRTYLKLKEYAKNHKKTISWAVGEAADMLPL